MSVYKLKNTVVLSFKGNAAEFLKGLTTNTLEAPFSAFVNIHGRIIATFRQQKISEDEVWIAVVRSAVEPLLEHLKIYARISGVKIEQTNRQVYVDFDSSSWSFKEEELPTNVSDEEFVQYRLGHNLPLQGEDFQADEFILNVDRGQYVSFTKGCFLGQEPVAKVYNRSKPSKKLIVKRENECSQEEKESMTSKVKDPKTGVVKGFVFVKT